MNELSFRDILDQIEFKYLQAHSIAAGDGLLVRLRHGARRNWSAVASRCQCKC